MDSKTVIIVSGLPRSGTSMMMKMLEAGGQKILTDDTDPIPAFKAAPTQMPR